MRLLFLVLLIINLAFASFLYWGPEPAGEQPAALPANLVSIEMLNEAGPVNPVSTEVSSPQASLPQCYTLGPLQDEDSVQAIMAALKGRATDIVQRSKQESRHHRYWVYIPVQKNRQAAIAMSQRLARKKVKDYYIVRGGDKNNSISLGHFKEKQHADRRIKSLKRLGFDAQIEPIYRQYRLFWLDYRLPADAHIDDGFWADLLPDGVSRLKRDCH